MENILQGIPQVCVYINDILIIGRAEEEHIQILDAVLQELTGECWPSIESGEMCIHALFS
jgi:hypothetical protein